MIEYRWKRGKNTCQATIGNTVLKGDNKQYDTSLEVAYQRPKQRKRWGIDTNTVYRWASDYRREHKLPGWAAEKRIKVSDSQSKKNCCYITENRGVS